MNQRRFSDCATGLAHIPCCSPLPECRWDGSAGAANGEGKHGQQARTPGVLGGGLLLLELWVNWREPQPFNSMVGAEGFEPPTLCSQSRCATRLRYAPISPILPRRAQKPNRPSSGNGAAAANSALRSYSGRRQKSQLCTLSLRNARVPRTAVTNAPTVAIRLSQGRL
jgi:hypothetical protein